VLFGRLLLLLSLWYNLDMFKRLLSLPLWAGLVIGGLIILLVALIFSSLNPWNPLNYLGKPTTTIDISRPTVIKEIQALNRLETASYTLDKIIEAGTDGNVFQNLLYGDKILLVAHGKVVAGVDLSKIADKDVTVSGSRLTITLPAAEVFSVALDNNQTKVFDRQLGLLSKGNKDLESQARAAAETSLRQAACDGGILNEARTNAINRLSQSYTLVGFTGVTVAMPTSTCQ
jgi:hypothetical protein